jgi:hypothetical protein
MGQTAISCTDRREASPEARPHRLTHRDPASSSVPHRWEIGFRCCHQQKSVVFGSCRIGDLTGSDDCLCQDVKPSPVVFRVSLESGSRGGTNGDVHDLSLDFPICGLDVFLGVHRDIRVAQRVQGRSTSASSMLAGARRSEWSTRTRCLPRASFSAQNWIAKYCSKTARWLDTSSRMTLSLSLWLLNELDSAVS